jgi:basic membrane lipoprotein Med (substrate-binding protein (PBP1-ABC) superfamily)
MAVNKVDLYVSQILEDLDNGLTWLKRDDLGYGNIQDKYGAKDQQITMIRKHPKLKDAETSVTIFNVIDDTNETIVETEISKPTRTTSTSHEPVVSVDDKYSTVGADQTADELSAFVNL